MYKEFVKSDNKLIFIVLGFIGALLFVFALVDMLNLPYTGIAQFACFIAIGIATYMLIRHKLADYVYLLIEDELIVQKKVGSNETVISAVNVEDMISVTHWADFTDKEKYLTHNVTKRIDRHYAYVLMFETDGKKQKLIFEPSAVLVDLIKERMLGNKH